MDISPSKNLFQRKRPIGESQDGAYLSYDGWEMDLNEPIEEIYHLALSHFYPSLSVSLLQRSMGIPFDKPLTQTGENRILQPFILNFSRQDQVGQAGSLRNYIILGSRPTYPFTIITFLRQVRFNPFDPWQYALPEPPYPTYPASILHWDVDTNAQLLRPRPPLEAQERLLSSHSVVDLDLLRIHSAWDIERDELVQTVIWCNSSGFDNRIFELRYGKEIASLELLKDLEAFVCFCGCGMNRVEDTHIKIFLKSGILFWFPYQKKKLENTKYFRYIRSERKGSTPFVYLDLSARTKEEMEKYLTDTKVDIRAMDLCVLDHQLALRFKNAKEHACWFASVHVLFLFAEWSTKKIFHITYRINGLNLTVDAIKIARLKDEDRRRLAISHTHDCARISADLPIKHFPKWSSLDQSLSKIVLDELGLELKLDFLSEWRYESGTDIASGDVNDVSNLMQSSTLKMTDYGYSS